MKKKTIWQTDDRQGRKYFSEKPTYDSGHEIFSGKNTELPKDRKSYRLITKFRVKVTGMFSERYKRGVLVKPWR